MRGAFAVEMMADIQKEEQRQQDERVGALLATLTPGELECLERVSNGMVSKEIARMLNLSPHTVDARLRVVTRKLGARNRFVAAQMLRDFLKNPELSDASITSNLIYEDLNLPVPVDADQMVASTGEGNGPNDFQSELQRHAAENLHGKQGTWLEPSHPFARFFGGENRLGIGRRLLIIIGIAIGTAMAFTAIVNSLIGLSRLISPP